MIFLDKDYNTLNLDRWLIRYRPVYYFWIHLNLQHILLSFQELGSICFIFHPVKIYIFTSFHLADSFYKVISSSMVYTVAPLYLYLTLRFSLLFVWSLCPCLSLVNFKTAIYFYVSSHVNFQAQMTYCSLDLNHPG